MSKTFCNFWDKLPSSTGLPRFLNHQQYFHHVFLPSLVVVLGLLLFKEAFFETLVTGHADEQEAQQLATVLAPLVTPGFGKEAEVERGWSVGGLGFWWTFFI